MKRASSVNYTTRKHFALFVELLKSNSLLTVKFISNKYLCVLSERGTRQATIGRSQIKNMFCVQKLAMTLFVWNRVKSRGPETKFCGWPRHFLKIPREKRSTRQPHCDDAPHVCWLLSRPKWNCDDLWSDQLFDAVDSLGSEWGVCNTSGVQMLLVLKPILLNGWKLSKDFSSFKNYALLQPLPPTIHTQ